MNNFSLTAYLRNISQSGNSSTFFITPAVLSFSLTVLVLYIFLLFSSLSIITMMAKNLEKLTSSRILILHQVIIEMQITSFYWPVNVVLLPLIHLNYVTVTSTFCLHFYYGYVITLQASWYGLLMLAINRFVAVVRPFSYRHWITRPVITMQLIIPWCIGIALSLRNRITDGGFFFSEKTRTCFVRTGPGFQISSIFGAYLPLALTCAMYIALFVGVSVNNRAQNVSIQPSGDSGTTATPSLRTAVASNNPGRIKRNERRINSAKGLCALSVIHFVGFATSPIILSIIPDAQARYPVAWQWIMLAYYLGYLSTPIIIAFTNDDAPKIGRRVHRALCRF
ncbi:uncharacterized protein LOC129586646 [Paramacrobiotus metropolitanus]|uniref:uncharacterized protein LOC129586646 n=1 Tax=Paramacrobiotus metropolitanus TaxID=2943436 RepID=UPI0024456D0F|nr:uncharacterized protein LOC129586646 [Paramacrobiotus metropolitanus]